MSFSTRAAAIVKSNVRSGDSFLPWKLQWDKGYAYSVALLSNHIIKLLVHFQAGAPASLCEKMYAEEHEMEDAHCEDCEKPGYQGKGKNRPTFVFCGLGHVFDLVDKEGTSSSGSKFKENPFKIVEVSGGKGQVNFEKLDMAESADPPYLAYDLKDKNPSIWSMKRLEEGGFLMPSLMDEREIKNKKLKLHSLTPETLEKYAKMPRPQVLGMIIVGYGNCKRDKLEGSGEFIFPEEVADTAASTEVDPTTELER